MLFTIKIILNSCQTSYPLGKPNLVSVTKVRAKPGKGSEGA